MKYPSQSSNPDRITLINSLVYQQRPTGTSNLEDPHPCSTASPRTPPPTPESQARTRLNIIIKSAFAAIEDDDPFGNGDSFKDGMDCHSDDRNQPSLQWATTLRPLPHSWLVISRSLGWAIVSRKLKSEQAKHSTATTTRQNCRWWQCIAYNHLVDYYVHTCLYSVVRIAKAIDILVNQRKETERCFFLG